MILNGLILRIIYAGSITMVNNNLAQLKKTCYQLFWILVISYSHSYGFDPDYYKSYFPLENDNYWIYYVYDSYPYGFRTECWPAPSDNYFEIIKTEVIGDTIINDVKYFKVRDHLMFDHQTNSYDPVFLRWTDDADLMLYDPQKGTEIYLLPFYTYSKYTDYVKDVWDNDINYMGLISIVCFCHTALCDIVENVGLKTWQFFYMSHVGNTTFMGSHAFAPGLGIIWSKMENWSHKYFDRILVLREAQIGGSIIEVDQPLLLKPSTWLEIKQKK
jgi:hypothetical protein